MEVHVIVWNKMERMMCVMKGEVPDRPPVTAYRHFPGMEVKADDIAKCMVEFQNEYDWDWMKVNPGAVYYYEVWGNKYNYEHYLGNVPEKLDYAIHNLSDFEKVVEYPGDYSRFGDHVKAIQLIRKQIPADLPVFQSVFAPIAVLLNLCGDKSPGRYREAPREKCVLLPYFREHPDVVHHALKNIAVTLADYVTKCLEAGADGIFFAEMGLAREGYLTYEEWKEFVVPYDKIVLEALNGRPCILHTCGIYGNPKRFVEYPINALHWAETAPGNPPIIGSESWLGKIAAMGGVNENLFGTNAAEKIGDMARKSVAGNRQRPFLLAPECTVPVNSLKSELLALKSASMDK
jgi:uroporphyrinogen decarboxylase